MSGPAGPIGRAKPLRYYSLAAKRARVFEDRRAFAAEMLIEGDPLGKPALAVLDRLGADILAIDLQQVEGTEDRERAFVA
jgi:hypothetical protein